ncbi:hypothetical protein [Lysobacter humi (ex Lee et al. 2017)]
MRAIYVHAARFAAVLLLPFALASTAAADGFDPTAPADGAVLDLFPVSAPAAAPEPAEAPAAFGSAVSVDRLADMRGGDGNVSTTINTSDLDGRVDGNTASNVIGGGNLVAGGSFGNSAGISTVIQNSGSNVLIQNSTIVNVQFVAPTP